MRSFTIGLSRTCPRNSGSTKRGADQLPDDLPELLRKATTGGLTEEEASVIAKALHRKQKPSLEWTEKRQKHDVEVNL